jgi:hypothetical protein
VVLAEVEVPAMGVRPGVAMKKSSMPWLTRPPAKV